MIAVKYVGAAALAALFFALMLVASSPSSAMPGWSHPVHPVVSINEEQRDRILQLHNAYRAALSNLDWSLDENEGHAPETMQQARELRMALRAEISEVLRRGGETAGSNEQGVCPYSGRKTPVRFDNNAPTLYL